MKYESLVIDDYKCVQISSLNVLCIKLWLKEDPNLHTDHFDIHSKSLIGRLTGKTLKKSWAGFPISSYAIYQNWESFQIRKWQQLEIHFPNLKSYWSFSRKVHNTFHHKTSKHQSPISWSFKTISKGEKSDIWLRNKNNLKIWCTEWLKSDWKFEAPSMVVHLSDIFIVS